MVSAVVEKRGKTVAAIASAAITTGGTSGVPTPLGELPKQGVIVTADLLMCIAIYAIWFDVRLSQAEMREVLLDTGLASVASGVLVYGGVKLTEGLLAEALNLLGPLGWLVSGTITASVTSLVGLTFWALCESPPPWLVPATA